MSAAIFFSICLAAAGPARAADVFPDGPLVELLPAGTVIGDGETAVTLRLVALGADGEPVSGDRLELSGEGALGALTASGSGLLSATWTPPAVSAPTRVDLSLKGLGGAEAIEGHWSVALIPPAGGAVSASADPGHIVLNRDPSATLSVQLSGASELLARSSAGAVEDLISLGDGRFSARYTPPAVSYPHTALLTFADARAPESAYGFLSLPLYGNIPYPVHSTPDASVILRIGDRDFGPYPTDSSGAAKVPIQVPPGTATATLITAAGGESSERTLDLKVPEARRLALLPAPRTVPADGGAITLRVAVVDASGAADEGARVRLSASVGSVGEVTNEGGGIYAAHWTPPAAGEASTVHISASLDGAPAVQTDTLDIALLPERASDLSLSVPGGIPEGAEDFEVQARVSGADGTGLSGRGLRFGARGARLSGEVIDRSGGAYSATFALTDGGDVSLTGAVREAPSGNPVQALVLIPSRDRLVPDGTSSTLITAVAVDRYGAPVPEVPIALSVGAGDGEVPASVTTDDSGLAQIPFTAGRRAGLSTVLASAGQARGGAAILQLPEGVAEDLLLPSAGSDWTRATTTAWSSLVNTLVLPREGGAAAASSARTRSSSGGTLSAITASAAGELSPGGTVAISVRALDGTGAGLSGQRLELEVIPATAILTPLTDVGGGTYTTHLSAPDGADEVKLIIASPDGSVARVLKIPVGDSSPWLATGEPAAEAAEGDAALDAAVPESEAAAPGEDWTWLRLGAGAAMGTYDYSQAPLDADGPLWNQGITFEYPAPTGGFALDAAAWLDPLDLPYLGLEAGARMAYYSTAWPGGNGATIGDWVPQVTALAKARYPFVSGGSRFHVGAKLGMIYGDFITYRKGATDSQLVYEPLPLPGLGLGAELGAELGAGVFINASLLEGLRGSSIFSSNVDLELGYDLPFGAFISGSYQLSARNIAVVAAPALSDVGVLEDRSNLFVLGAGYRL